MQKGPTVHGRTQVLATTPLRVRTPDGPWEYAVSFGATGAPFAEHVAADAGFVTDIDLEVVSGRIGAGWTTPSGTTMIEERYVDSGRAHVHLAVPPAVVAGMLVFRNADRREASEFVVHSIAARSWGGSRPLYDVRIASRDYGRETISVEEGTGVFEDEGARTINRARMAWLDASGLPLTGRRVLDVGCGPGHFARYYVERGCSVVGVDGRADNIDALRAALPQVEGHVGDVQNMDLRALGEVDVVHCFGLLYHLDSPVAALRRMERACGDLLVLETMVCDSSRAVAVLADESKSWNQALEGLGCRPSPTYVALALNRIGFPFVYGSMAPPDHPDFRFEWQDNLDVTRDGHNLRCMFVASRSALAHPTLGSLLDQ